ncbi:MAG: hypothetical protein QQN41_05385, partial [Nitrosopumilus sp.]
MQQVNEKQAIIIAFAGNKINSLTNYREKLNAIKIFTRISGKYDVSTIENSVLIRALGSFVQTFGADFNADTIKEY